jgi:hypothetical protein
MVKGVYGKIVGREAVFGMLDFLEQLGVIGHTEKAKKLAHRMICYCFDSHFSNPQ